MRAKCPVFLLLLCGFFVVSDAHAQDASVESPAPDATGASIPADSERAVGALGDEEAATADAESTDVGPAAAVIPPAEQAPPATDPAVDRRLLILDFRGERVHNDDRSALRTLVADSFLRLSDLEVTTADDIRQLVDLEADREALECDVASCLGEIAGAYGVRFVVLGQVERLGDLFVLTITLFDSFEVRPVGKQTIQNNSLGAFATLLDTPVRALLAALSKSTDLNVSVSKVAPSAAPPTPTVAPGPAVLAPPAAEEESSVFTSPIFIAGLVALAGGVAVAALGAGGAALSEAGLSQRQVPASAKLGFFIGGWAGLAGVVVGGGVAIAGGVGSAIGILAE